MSAAIFRSSEGVTKELVPERALWLAARRDLGLGFRSKGELIQALAFLVIVVSLFPLAVGPESAAPALLAELA